MKISNDIIALSHDVNPEGYFKWQTEKEFKAFLAGVGAMAEKVFEYFRGYLQEEQSDERVHQENRR